MCNWYIMNTIKMKGKWDEKGAGKEQEERERGGHMGADACDGAGKDTNRLNVSTILLRSNNL